MYETPITSGNDDDQLSAESTDYPARKRWILNLLIIYAMLLGVVFPLLRDDADALLFVSNIPVLMLTLAWCVNDAAEREIRIGGITRVLVILALIVGLPLYLFRSRGLYGFVSVGLATLFAVLLLAVGTAANVVTLKMGEVMGFWEFPL